MSRETVELRLLAVSLAAADTLNALGLGFLVPTVEDLESRSWSSSIASLAQSTAPLWSAREPNGVRPGGIGRMFPAATDDAARTKAIACANLICEIEAADLLLQSEGEGSDDVLEALLDLGIAIGRADALVNGQLEQAVEHRRLKLKQTQAARKTHAARTWWRPYVLPVVKSSRLASRAGRIKFALAQLERQIELGRVIVPPGERVPKSEAVDADLKRQAKAAKAQRDT